MGCVQQGFSAGKKPACNSQSWTHICAAGGQNVSLSATSIVDLDFMQEVPAAARAPTPGQVPAAASLVAMEDMHEVLVLADSCAVAGHSAKEEYIIVEHIPGMAAGLGDEVTPAAQQEASVEDVPPVILAMEDEYEAMVAAPGLPAAAMRAMPAVLPLPAGAEGAVEGATLPAGKIV